MLKIYPATATASLESTRTTKKSHAVWFDLLNPTPEEKQQAADASGLKIPERDQISGIELSSRIRAEGDVLYLNIPYFSDAAHDNEAPTPLGFLLTSDVLVSLRYADTQAFDLAESRVEKSASVTSIDAFITIMETIINLAADQMEGIAAELGQLSHEVLAGAGKRSSSLRVPMLQVARLESRLTRMRSSLIGVLRVVTFAHDGKPKCMDMPSLARLLLAKNDLVALNEFDAQLTDKLQFLLDAILGIINTDQNEVMKVLTVASVAGIPPVILAGIWGMNFKNMPELATSWGYPVALLTMLVSCILPLLWFKRRGWL